MQLPVAAAGGVLPCRRGFEAAVHEVEKRFAALEFDLQIVGRRTEDQV